MTRVWPKPLPRRPRKRNQRRRRPPLRRLQARSDIILLAPLRTKALFLIAILAGGTSLSGADESNADATARFLAGLPVTGTALEERASEPAWRHHAAEFERQWSQFETGQLSNIRRWAPQALGRNFSSQEPMFYMFSGPDFLYANAFFPNASTYILCGTEPVGPVPDINAVPTASLPSALANLRKALESSLSWSFFITRHMKVDLKQKQLSGTLPILYVFLARAHYTIESVTLVTLDEMGNLVDASKKRTAGVKIVVRAPDAREQTLYYFTTDLADWSVNTNPGFLKFCEQQGRGVSLLKAASYLMHGNHFVHVREFLLASSDVVVQDDSGIPYHFFEQNKWAAQCYGKFLGPIAMFKQYPQHDLVRLYAEKEVPPIDFSFGYQWRPARSSLMVATPP